MTEMTIEAAAKNQGVAESTIRRRIKSGELAAGPREGTVLVVPRMDVPPFHGEIVAGLRDAYRTHGSLRAGPMPLARYGLASVDAGKLRAWLDAQS